MQWCEKTLKVAKAEDIGMQTLVGQMLCTGYSASVNMKEMQHSSSHPLHSSFFCVHVYSGWGGAKCGTLYMCAPLLAVLVLLLQAAFKEERCSFGKQGKALRPHGYPTDTQIRHHRKKQWWAFQNCNAHGGGQLHFHKACPLFTPSKALSKYTKKNQCRF